MVRKLDILKFDPGYVKIMEPRHLAEVEELRHKLGYANRELFPSKEIEAIDAIIRFIKEYPVQP